MITMMMVMMMMMTIIVVLEARKLESTTPQERLSVGIQRKAPLSMPLIIGMDGIKMNNITKQAKLIYTETTPRT